MAITLGALTFDDAHTTVREKYEEVGGRDERIVEINGAIASEHSAADIEAKLDAILEAASDQDYGAALSLRAGRRLWVRRDGFTREISAKALVGSFKLTLAAKNPLEESAETTSVDWDIGASGATKFVNTQGNVFGLPTIALAAEGAVVKPSFSDGQRAITYEGTVADGETLVFDATAGKVWLESEDVTPYVSGAFPRIEPGGTTITYTDDAASSHTAAATVKLRDRWW